MATRPDVQIRHRRQRNASRRRILEAAAQLVEDRPWAEVTIEDVAGRAGLSRTAFYRHFDDRRALLMALFEDLGDELDLVADPWETGGPGDPRQQLRAAVAALVEAFSRHGRLLRAISDESAQDSELSALYSGLGERFAASAAERIERDRAAGLSTVGDPAETAAALVWMNERYLLDRFGRAPIGDPERAAAALSEIWLRVVYGETAG